MNRFLLFALFFLLSNSVASAQALPTSRPDAVAHAQSVLVFQQNLNQEFSNPQESPLTAAERKAFRTLPFYPANYAYCVLATLVRDSTARPFAMETSTTRRPLYRKYGELRFVLNGQALQLNV